MIKPGLDISIIHQGGITKGILEKFDDDGVLIVSGKKHTYIPSHNIFSIEYRDKKLNENLSNWIEEGKEKKK